MTRAGNRIAEVALRRVEGDMLDGGGAVSVRERACSVSLEASSMMPSS